MGIPVISDIIQAIAKPIDDLVGDTDLKRKLKAEIQGQLFQLDMAQIAVNQQEAAHKSLYVAGWRPFIGWVCGVAIAWAFLGQHVAEWAVAIWAPGTPIPEVESDRLMELVLAMLGMAGLRTYEKRAGVAREK
ncbi:MAG: hypothetical protein KatS3mg119_1902 [Rhodothalassiaceae bacterium]|nr:MAG: hypothetical protein KatS3mg119_1902 [Rhodothalassiaceae bacterium]